MDGDVAGLSLTIACSLTTRTRYATAALGWMWRMVPASVDHIIRRRLLPPALPAVEGASDGTGLSL
jgi:hypothetical protein